MMNRIDKIGGGSRCMLILSILFILSQERKRIPLKGLHVPTESLHAIRSGGWALQNEKCKMQNANLRR